MIYDDLKKCTIDELELLIDKLREKLSFANDRLVMLEAEADSQFMNYCEAQEELEILRDKNEKTASLFKGLLAEFNKIHPNAPSTFFIEVGRLETKFNELYPDREGLPF